MSEQILREQLSNCSLHSFQIILQTLLSREGFGEVTILGRHQPKQKSREAGHELVCQRVIGPVSQTTLVKVIRGANIRVRSVDEMSGNIVRFNATEGLIVTDRKACNSTTRVLSQIEGSRVQVLNGIDIARLMVKHKLGLRKNGETDYEYFPLLDEFTERVQPILNDVRKWT